MFASFYDISRILVAVVGGSLVIYIGLRVLRFVGQKSPDPPPPGDLRKVRLTFICSICSSEVRMLVAPVEDPEPPKHCGEEMDPVAPIDE